jgi:hypothetical protein
MAYVPAPSGRQFKLKYKRMLPKSSKPATEPCVRGEAMGMGTGDQSPRQASRPATRLWPLLDCGDGGRRGGAAAQRGGHAALAGGEAGRQLRGGSPGSRSRVAIFFGGKKQKERCEVYVGWPAGIGVLAHFGTEFGRRPNSTEGLFSCPLNTKCKMSIVLE